MLPTNPDNQDASNKALLSRLYKNYESQKASKNKAPMTMQMLSPKDKIIPDRQLIPRIALKKQLDLSSATQPNILPVTINKGKILLTPQGAINTLSLINQSSILAPKDQSTLNLTTSFVENTKKEGFSTKNLEHIKIIDDIKKTAETQDLKASGIGSPTKKKTPLKIGSKEKLANSAKKKKFKTGKQNKEKKETGDYLTPIDFIHLIRTDPEMTDEFCYLNKRTHSYDFQIVDFNERNNEEYMTISARGITHFFDGEASFMTIEEWEREVKMFYRLRDIPYFQKYKIWKNFSLWKKHTRRNIMKDRSKVLSQQLFFLDKHLRRPLLEIRNICLHLSKLEFMDLSSSDPLRYEEFRNIQENYRVTLMDKKFDTLENAIKDLIQNSCQTSLIAFKEENRIPNKDPDNPSGENEEPAPLLVGDETNKEMPYTQEATIRTHYKRLRKFIKLVDYLILNGKLNMMEFSSDLLCRSILEHNASVKDPRRNMRLNCWIICEIGMKDRDLTFIPSREITKKIFEEVVNKGVARICSKHKQLIHFPELITYTRSGEIEEENNEELLDIQNLIYNDDKFKDTNVVMKKELDVSFDHVLNFAKFLIPYLNNYHTNIGTKITEYEDKEIEEFKNAIALYKKQDAEFQAIEAKSELGLFLFDNHALKDLIKSSASVCLNELTKLMPDLVFRKAKSFVDAINEMNAKLTWTPNEAPMTFVEQFVSFTESVTQIAQKMEEYTSTNSEIGALLYLIIEEKIKIPEAYKGKVQEASTQINSLRKKIEESNASYDQNLTKCKRKLEKYIPEMEDKLKEISAKVHNSGLDNKDADVDKTVIFIKEIEHEIYEIYNQSLKVNNFQKSLQLEENRFDKIVAFQQEFVLITKLWNSRKLFKDSTNQWSLTHFLKVDVENMVQTIEKLAKIANECAKDLETNEAARLLKLNIEEYKGIVDSLISLRDPAVGDKQWNEIREVLRDDKGKTLENLSDPMYTLGYLVRMDFMKHMDTLKEIALKAAKEADLIKIVENVELVWKTAFINVQSYKDSKDISILGNNEDLISRIDDTLLTLNNIMASRFVEGIRNRVEIQMKLFRFLQELLDEWLLHQRNWIYLEPIFSSQNTHMGLMKEVKSFNSAHQNWVKLMKKARENNGAQTWASDYVAKTQYKMLKKNNEIFDTIQKALDDYLEKKRDTFHRFFFLSSDELLEILSTSKTIHNLQPHLRKVFENIARLEFDKDQAIAMVSAEGESVLLKNFLPRGEVEEWMKMIEDQMKKSLTGVMRQACIQYEREETQRKDWVFQHPLQVITTVDSIYWTKITEEEYLAPDAEGDMDDWYQSNLAQLDELIQLIRGSLAPNKRKTLVALVTQDVHYRDIVEQLSIERVESISDFKWAQQLRFYMIDESVSARQVNSNLLYGYEFLGATTRLVITPLTDRCWMTITGALHIKLGAQPSGPAGTGKTESCKDLAKALAKYCIVFNCSEQVNVKIMEKLFIGLCCTGSWSCLDEFNRIDIEVLSVIAQQVLTIREALLIETKENKTQFAFFSKTNITLDKSMGIFITMNPGYAGRTELPDNLKVLFRPVSMMVPNYDLIAEIMLFAEGFSEAKELSRKMTKLYKLCSEQLSQQDHYDFGMRAVKSVLVMAGNLKRAEPKTSEEAILIRAMRDSNMPKFLSFDLPLFHSIVTDLFPGSQIPELENKELENAIKSCLDFEKLKYNRLFIEKILQLHETLKVRFGVMVVGPTMGGKSTIINTLKSAYSSVKEKIDDDPKNEYEIKDRADYQHIESITLNPKSISMNELYGELDMLTQTWTDGLAAKIMREYVSKEGPEKKWVVFDGPVDSLWIENMNTVLDDSMTLCLSNGERIKLKPEMKMLFEVMDLAVASPATVSRCGMVFVDQDALDYRCVIETFFELYILPLIPKDLTNHLLSLLQLNFKKALSSLRKKSQEPIPTVENSLAIAICRNLKVFLEDEPTKKFFNSSLENFKKPLDKLFISAFSWGIAGSFSNIEIYEKVCSEIFNVADLPKGSIFGNYVSFGKIEGEYLPWETILPEFIYNPKVSYFDLVVPTNETVCYSWLLEHYIRGLLPVFMTGVTGTGKTIILSSTLEKLKNEGSISSLQVTFSAQTSAKSIQLQIESKLQSQRKQKKIILMPPPGKKLVIFIDDINMPQVEIYGTQPPIELLRQYNDYKGFYDRKTHVWKDLDNTVLLAAAAPPGGGRSELSQRFTRHFNILCLPNPSTESMTLIFNSILKGFLKENAFRSEIIELAESQSIVTATLQIYQQISKELLPTPIRSHYTFNLRDVSKIFQGLLLAKPTQFSKPDDFIKLWLHECCRVFHDRLINDSDRRWLLDNLLKMVFVYLKNDWKREQVFESELPLLYVDFLKRGIELERRVYEEVKDMQKLIKIIKEYMSEETKLNLVLFKDAIEHLSRIARVLRQQRGHFMLVGVGGSGKKALTALASVLAGCEMFTVEPRKIYGRKEFREDVFKIMQEAAFKHKEIVFMLSESQIIHEVFLEDINNLLNSGEIPNLLQKDDVEVVNSNLGQEAKEKGFPDAYTYFVDRVRNHMHIVLGMSPIGNEFRNRLRMFPSLVNCCTINWLNPWPEEALFSVARMFLESIDGLTEELLTSLASLCVFVHQNVNEEADNFFNLYKRKVYTTPKSYIDLIESYKDLLRLKNNEISTNRNKLSNGLFKLEQANSTIQVLKETLIKLQPELKQKTIEQEELIKKLEIDGYEAKKKKLVVAEEERIVNEKADKIKESKEEADRRLNEAMPILIAATEALNTLNRNDISEIKSQPSPHALVRFTLECVAVLLDEKSDPDSIKKLLADPNFLSRMKTLKAENITKNTQDKIKKKINSNPNFIPSEIQKINIAAKSICEWVRAVSEYTDVWKETEKKRVFVEEMNKELEGANAVLSKKQDELIEVNRKVMLLEQQYTENKKEKDRLDEEIQRTEARLTRASDLTKGLEDEQIRWKENVKLLSEDLKVLLGNVFLAGASVSYYGPFTGPFREKMIFNWLAKCIELNIPCSEKYTLQKILGNPVEIRDWNSKGLPSDSVSVNNGILVKHCRAYPMMIDPQMQANRWIKNLLTKDNLKVTKLKSDTLLKTIELCVRMSEPLLIEDVEETLDPMLEPLLLKQYTYINNRKLVKIGDSEPEIYDSFKIYFSTKIANPNFLPEIFIRVTVINFTVTSEGLEEQLLGHVVRREMPEVEVVRSELIVSIARDKANLKRNEDRILDLLNDSKGLILDDIDLIKSLQESKATNDIVKEKLQQAETKQVEIELARAQYKIIATRGSIIYFVIADLSLIDPMYQFSLTYFTKLFNSVIENTAKNDNLSQRITILINNITETIYINVCRGLFNIHKKIFSFLLSAQIQLKVKKINMQEWNMFLKGPSVLTKRTSVTEENRPIYLTKVSDSQWNSLISLKQSNAEWSSVLENMKLNSKLWDDWIQNPEPHLIDLPDEFDKKISLFQKLLLIRLLRFEKTIYALDIYVERFLSKKFSSTIPATMEEAYKDIDPLTPLIFILSNGADPLMNLLAFAKDKKVSNDKLFIISLGQGQGPLADKAIEKALSMGGWAILQNCHLGKSFMPELEKKLELLENPEFVASLNPECFQKFRLFLTSMPCTYFPVSILQNGMKLTNEPPKGVKANITKTYNEMSVEKFEGNLAAKPKAWKKLVFSLACFHAVVQERRKFGPLGWNILYEFNESDLESSLTMLKIMLENHQDIPWDALNYMTGEINYGGRVTDEWDRRCLLSILNRFLTEDVLTEGYTFSDSGVYTTLSDEAMLPEYMTYIGNLPDIEKPELFGMHDNANITFQLKETRLTIETILNIQPREASSSGSAESSDDIVKEILKTFEEKLPLLLRKDPNKETIKVKLDYIDSLEICLMQEAERFNKLLTKIKSSILQLNKALKGEEVMSADLDKMYQRILNNQVPELWNRFAYPSIKALANWFDDLIQRVNFFKVWIDNDKPMAYWLSAFFFPQGFLTSILQNYARKFKLPIDILGFSYKFSHFTGIEQITQPPNEGSYIYGLFVEGCRFDIQKGLLEESEPGVMSTLAPIINFIPTENYTPDERDYSMPVYKTPIRAGTLSTTGHSTNFIIAVECQSKRKPEFWILNGAAFTCALNN